MTRSAAVLGMLSILAVSAAFACGPEGSLARSGSKGREGLAQRGGFMPGLAQQSINPQFYAGAMMQMRMNQQRQLLAMQAAARRARMRPQRIARYKAERERIAARRQRTYEMLAAQRQERLQQQQQPSTTPDSGRVLLASNPTGFAR